MIRRGSRVEQENLTQENLTLEDDLPASKVLDRFNEEIKVKVENAVGYKST